MGRLQAGGLPALTGGRSVIPYILAASSELGFEILDTQCRNGILKLKSGSHRLLSEGHRDRNKSLSLWVYRWHNHLVPLALANMFLSKRFLPLTFSLDLPPSQSVSYVAERASAVY